MGHDQISSLADSVTAMKDLIDIREPQCLTKLKSDENKIHFLRDAVTQHSFSSNSIQKIGARQVS